MRLKSHDNFASLRWNLKKDYLFAKVYNFKLRKLVSIKPIDELDSQLKESSINICDTFPPPSILPLSY